MKKQINTTAAPAAIGPYSQAIEANGMVFVSGQLPIDPATGAFAEGGIKELTRQSLTNMKAILAEAGLTMANVVKTTVFLADMADFAEMNEVYASFFQGVCPARSAVAVKTFPKEARVEIECIAGREVYTPSLQNDTFFLCFATCKCQFAHDSANSSDYTILVNQPFVILC